MSIYEKAFEKSDKTDAVLLVDGKKLHVNKALLSYHSTHFKTLFNAEKSVKEVKIKDVNFKDFAAFLSLVQDQPIIPTTLGAVSHRFGSLATGENSNRRQVRIGSSGGAWNQCVRKG
ncbi:hypothetical protein CAEBREN_19615 [Caenorhabditis brenneri]|uniref:BTB domain-containing protein n=1 Tax=Caenorhabditis brenneri TaxID=135651 RepID=G0MVV8_CAEBE|nr:hypothetical protein CAEBREN_19615 [Caenorhabditis brenneri]